MTPQFAEKLREKLEEFERFADGKSIASCRLVHYAGANKPNAIDVSPQEITKQISGCLAEGFYVDWFHTDSCVHLLVQEPGCPIPTWEKVIAEEALVDVDALLKRAGLSDV